MTTQALPEISNKAAIKLLHIYLNMSMMSL